MSDSSERPVPPLSPGSGPGPDASGAREDQPAPGRGGGSTNGSRNRSRGAGQGGRGGGQQGGSRNGAQRGGQGGGHAGSRGGGGSSGGRSAQSRAGSGGNAGGKGASGGGGNRRGGGGSQRSGSGNRRPSGGGSSDRDGSRTGSGGRADRTQDGSGSERVVAASPPVRSVDRGTESIEEASAIRANRRQAVILCLLPGIVAGVIVGLILVVAGLPLVGAAAVVVLAVALSVWLWRTAPGAVARSVGARHCDEWEQPRLHNLVDGLCATMGLPRPSIAVVDCPVPNAMALGRDPGSAVLVVTSGLDEELTLVELEGVLAHELVHIKRHDAVLAGVAVVVTLPWATIRGSTVGASAVHLLIGRGREFSADQRAAGVVRYPAGIGTALDAMVDRPASPSDWPPGRGRTAALTRWLWINPMVGAPPDESPEGNLDDTRVRAAALSLR